MADLKISQLPSATTPLAGTEVLPIVQSSATKQVSIANLTAGRSISVADATLTAGNLVIGTSGKGIDFSATSQAGGMTSELLNDYEEGTFTPVLNDMSGGTITYASQVGKYTKIGRQVTVFFSIAVGTNTNTTGNVSISMPFAANSNGYVGNIGMNTTTYSAANHFSFYTASAALYTYNYANSVITASQFTNGSILQGNITYFT